MNTEYLETARIASTRPAKLRPPAKVYRLIKRKVKGKTISRYWQVRVRLARGKYQQKSAQTEHRESAREFALLWIKQDFPQLCPLLDLKPLVKPSLPPPHCHNRKPVLDRAAQRRNRRAA